MQYGIVDTRGNLKRSGLTKDQALELSKDNSYIPVYLDSVYKGLHIWKPMCHDNRDKWEGAGNDQLNLSI